MKQFYFQLIAIILLAGMHQSVNAQPPANDECSGATVITTVPFGDVCHVALTCNTTGATRSVPNPSCTSSENGDDIWYKFTATTASIVLRFSNAINLNTGGNAIIGYALYETDCPANKELRCNNIGSAGAGFQIISGLTKGTSYFLRFWSTLTGGNAAAFDFCVQEAAAPANDNCADAIEIATQPVGTVCNSGTAVTTVGATNSLPTLTCSSGFNDDDVWYSFIAITSAIRINFSNARSATSTSGNGNVGYALYEASCPVEAGNAINCKESIGNGSGSELVGGLVPGNRYFIRLFSFGTNNYITFDFCLVDVNLPLNDECRNAVELTVSNSFCSAPLLTSLTNATTSPGFGSPDCVPLSGSEDVWYKVTVPSSGNFVIQTSVADYDINDLVMEAYSGTCESLNLIVCDDNGNPDAGYNALHPKIELTGRTPGETIFIRMLSKGTINFGSFTICAWDATILSDVSEGGNCVSADPVIINSAKGNQYLWVPLFDASGNIFAEINANGAELGKVNASLFVNETGGIRAFQGIKYLDRNLTFESSGMGSVKLRIYFTRDEFVRLQSSDTLIEDLSGLAISRNDDDCRAAMNQGGEHIQQDTSGIYGNDYYVEFRTGLSSSFYFTRQSGTLPVEFISFTAKCHSNSVLLEWATAFEQNSAGFEIEKSSDGRNFKKKSFIPGVGNSSVQHNYNFTDMLPDAANLFYRIRQIDKDGKFRYSEVVPVSCGKVVTALRVFPNPVSSEMVVEFDNRIRNVAVLITDVSGKEVLLITHNSDANGRLKINVASLVPGVYFLRLQSTAMKKPGIVKFIKLE